MSKLNVKFPFPACLLMILPNIQVFLQIQSLYHFINSKSEELASSVFSTFVNKELPTDELKAAFSAKGGSASGGNTYSLSSEVNFHQLKIRDPKTSLPDGKAGSG